MRIGIIDSGIHRGHPHVGEVAGGVSFTGDGDSIDRLGHGTAVAGAIRERNPTADLFAVKVFDWRLRASMEAILQAIRWCVENRMDVINLSLGTENPAHSTPFAEAAGEALIVGPAGALPVTIPVIADPDCPRDTYRFENGNFVASPYPRSIPGVPTERNLSGVSFAVANMTGFAARALAATPRARLLEELMRAGRRC